MQHLGVLEENGEFKEFTDAGGSIPPDDPQIIIDWDDLQMDLAHLGGATPRAAKSGGDKLWNNNWNDNDIKDEFSMQLWYMFS